MDRNQVTPPDWINNPNPNPNNPYNDLVDNKFSILPITFFKEWRRHSLDGGWRNYKKLTLPPTNHNQKTGQARALGLKPNGKTVCVNQNYYRTIITITTTIIDTFLSPLRNYLCTGNPCHAWSVY